MRNLTEDALNALFPGREVRISHQYSAPEYDLARLGSLFRHGNTVKRSCPRIDWKIEGKQMFAFVRPHTVMRNGRDVEDIRGTFDEAVRLIRASDRVTE